MNAATKPFLKLKKAAKARVRSGHPWVFAGEVESVPSTEWDGGLLDLRDERGRFLGSGIFNSRSKIVWRRVSREALADLDQGFFQKAISAAVARRKEEPFRRLVWSEADGLPGLIVDQFDDVLVVQTMTLGMDMRLSTIADVLQALLGPREMIFRNDAPARAHEGMDLTVSTLSGKPFSEEVFAIDGFNYKLNLYSGQKTGFYLDQRKEHAAIAQYASGRRVLDAFCNMGAFGLHAAKAGAASVTAIDISSPCIEAAKETATENGVEVNWVCANVFDWFGKARDSEYDLIVLDPPSFARNRSSVPGALRGYKELNLRAMKLLTSGGILATYSCSHSVSREMFQQVVTEAAADARADLQVIRVTTQPEDHPILLNVPETHYLNGFVLQKT